MPEDQPAQPRPIPVSVTPPDYDGAIDDVFLLARLVRTFAERRAIERAVAEHQRAAQPPSPEPEATDAEGS